MPSEAKMSDKILIDYFFDSKGNIHLKNKKENNPPVLIKGMEVKPAEEEERLSETEKAERLKLMDYYSAKYPNLSIEQIGQLIDDPNIGLGEDFVINKILKKYQKV